MRPEERQRGILVQVVDAAQRRRLALVVQQVADVVQERRAYERARRALGFTSHCALQRVLELRNALAFVLPVASCFIQRKNFPHYHGSEYVFTLVKLFIASITPSL